MPILIIFAFIALPEGLDGSGSKTLNTMFASLSNDVSTTTSALVKSFFFISSGSGMELLLKWFWLTTQLAQPPFSDHEVNHRPGFNAVSPIA